MLLPKGTLGLVSVSLSSGGKSLDNAVTVPETKDYHRAGEFYESVISISHINKCESLKKC